ncbi:hypothetical protein BHE74_00039797 [Ensete ventricosum]|nr:hypothetical protein BHE74_00039797 [Ensete ventricosum]
MPSLLVTSTTSAAIPRVSVNGFPSFLPKEVDKIRDPFARDMAKRIERLPVKISFSTSSIMSSCVKPLQERGTEPVVLLHGFDSSCLEWRYSYPLLEGAGIDTWAVDILGWGFSDLQMVPPCNVAAKREHLYQVGRLHCLQPWWEDATVDFMLSGGYDVGNHVKQVRDISVSQPCPAAVTRSALNYCIHFGKQITMQRLHHELPDSTLVQIPGCGHLPHVEKPELVVQYILKFIRHE